MKIICKLLISLGGWILAAAIVLARALQANSIPMENWSVLSWFYMTLPITFKWIYFFIYWTVYLIVSAIWMLSSDRHRRKTYYC